MKENHKAKRRDSGEWVSGGYTTKALSKCSGICKGCVSDENDSVHYIITEDENKSPDITAPFICYEVEPNTICKALGLTDITGSEIYTHDILMFTDYVIDEDGNQTNLTFDNYIEVDEANGRIRIVGIGEKRSYLVDPTSPFSYDYDLFLSALTQSAVIGNKYDD